MNEHVVHSEKHSNGVERAQMFNEDRDKSYSDATSLFREDNKALVVVAESRIFTSHEMSLFWGFGEQNGTENSAAQASETNLKSEDAGEKENELIVEKVAAPQVPEEPLHEHELSIIRGTSNGQNCENESLKLENTNSSPAGETSPRDAWRSDLVQIP
ncbi:uncharacterized protein LOC123203160 isoform X2 [Mangifera indica]|nr:uncharacterized protein LOC123203160 isoform X2 [Mangifera indica]